jgi:hypothetical protein
LTKPEDCVALYNELLKSSAFSYFTEEVGGSPAQISKFRGLERPFLVAWNEADRKRVQIVWEIFVRNLNDSPDFFLQKQAVNFKGIEMPAGLNEEDIISQYEEYWPDIQAAKKNVLPTEKQGQSEASDLTSDVNDFISTEATRSQALAIKPRLMAYQNNLVQEMQSKSGAARHNLMMAVKAIDRGLLQVESILNRASLEVGGGEAVSSKPAEVVPKTVTNILRVVNYLGIPQKDFPKDEKFLEEDKTWGLRIVGSRWVAGKLVMDLRYHCEMHINGSGGDVTKAVAAIFDPVNESWKMLEYPPEFDGTGYPQWPYDAVSFEIYHDDFIFSDGGQIQKYDFTNKQWENFQVLGLHNSKLFVVEGHLYATNNESIFEIAENGKGTHILASTRRRPAVSALDSLSGLGSPVLFSGLDHALCASLGNENFGRSQNKSYSWDEHDWHEMFNLKTACAAEVFEDAVIFRFSPWDTLNYPSMVWLWDKHEVAPDLALYDPPKIFPPSQPGAKSTTPAMSPLWRSMENYSLANASMTYFKSNLFLYVDQASAKQLPNGRSVFERGGCDADLICLDRNYPEPIVVPLKYDLNRGPLPWSGFPADLSPVWMSFTSDFLLIGNNTVPGVWVIPIAEIGAAVATQKQALLAKKH